MTARAKKVVPESRQAFKAPPFGQAQWAAEQRIALLRDEVAATEEQIGFLVQFVEWVDRLPPPPPPPPPPPTAAAPF